MAHPPKEAGGKPHRFARMGARVAMQWVAPFVNTLANVTNASLEWTPIGYTKGIRRKREGMTKARYEDSYYRATTGSAVLAAIAYAIGDDDEDGFISITGRGNPDSDKRRVEEAAGWTPYTLKIGDWSINYKETVFAGGLVAIATAKDCLLYTSPSPRDRG